MSADPAAKVDKAVAAYQKKFGRLPKNIDTLVAFSTTKEPGVSKLTKKKHGDLIAAKLEECKSAAASKKKKSGKKKGGSSTDVTADTGTPTTDEDSAAAAPPKKKAPKQEYPIDTTILLSSDRIGIVRWFGFLPSRKGYFYGVEFLGSFVGNCDGAFDGIRYFQTAEDRAKFFPPSKIRKAASQKDIVKILGHERSQSWLARNTGSGATSASQAAGELPAVSETDSGDAKDGEGEAGDDDTEEEAPAAVVEDDDEDDEEDDEKAAPIKSAASSKKKKSRPVRSSTVVEQIDIDVISSRETELEFILRQNDSVRELLLDIYCNPALSKLYLAAYEQVKTLDIADQPRVWKDLISRWRLHL